jgi:molecular chaperone GrpE
MRSGWEKMTRWAGIGHNGKDVLNGKETDGMVDEMSNVVEQEQGEGAVERVEAGLESHGAAAESSAADAGTQDSSELAQLRGERDQLRSDVQGMTDRLARLQAEFDNARKREAKERADAREYTVGSTIEPFLGVMDNFQLALKAQGSLEQLKGGVELILKQMEEALRGLNVTAVESVGTQFDPRVHEALGSVETAEFPDHQVIEEIRRGYKIREKLLRPAMVKIAVNAGQVND